MIFAVDIADDYVNALTKLCALVVRSTRGQAAAGVKALPFDVLLHKADCLAEADRQGTS